MLGIVQSSFLFQSTLPLRGATCTAVPHRTAGGYFNPRSPYGERQRSRYTGCVRRGFQSTLPLRGATSNSVIFRCPCQFQSTLPLRGATLTNQSSSSIEAYFNPRSPYGERRGHRAWAHSAPHISIHAPLTGSDRRLGQTQYALTRFQSTLPLRGATIVARLCRCRDLYFNPRSPYGERLSFLQPLPSSGLFQSTLPLRGATGVQ